jgi:hypothetical protein
MPLTRGRQSANASNHWRNEFPFAASGIEVYMSNVLEASETQERRQDIHSFDQSINQSINPTHPT